MKGGGSRKIEWKRRESWIAVFDILGFRHLIREADQDFPRALLTRNLSDLLGGIADAAEQVPGLEAQVISDTIVLFAPDLAPTSYPNFLRVCKDLMHNSIRVRLPLQGAIAAGISFTTDSVPVLIGPAFVEAYEFCEAQDWLGLLLVPSATRSIRHAGLEPLRHDFVSDDVPWRSKPPAGYELRDTLAYRFQNGEANFSSPLFVGLHEMEAHAPEAARQKYRRTIDFIQKHYRYISPPQHELAPRR